MFVKHCTRYTIKHEGRKKMIKVSVPKGKDPFEKIREDVSPEVIATSWINIQKEKTLRISEQEET